ncbi:MAG: sulfurtransferase TusA family protein [Syntrophobacteraceae bacterium]|jgi:TusA-related sulfurtransferase
MKPDERLDLRGVIEPCCFLSCKATLASMRPGTVLEILVKDPETVMDLLTILERSGEIVLGSERQGDHYRLLVRKRSD